MQSFSPTHYLKRPELLVPIAAGLHAGSAHRQLARSLGCDPSTVTRQVARLGRHCILLSARALENIDRITEPVVFDHFESFVYSQDYQTGLGTAMGQETWYNYDQQLAPHKRPGRISPAQQEKQDRLYERFGKPPTGEYTRSTRECLDLLLRKSGDVLELVTDGHKAYRQALAEHPQKEKVTHRIYPNPKRGPKGSPRAPEAIERDNEMFAVDFFHGLMRHTCIHQKRETIAFGRRSNAMAERGFMMMVWRNFVKWRSERKRDKTTAAMLLGLSKEPWSWMQVLSRRLFPGRLKVPDHWMKVYRRDWITKAVGNNQRHRLEYAY